MNNDSTSAVWIFHGEGGRFGSAVFTNIDAAEDWIGKHKLTGLLTLYPLNIGVYDWAIENEFFETKTEKQKSSQFIQGFTSAAQDHFHYENSERI